MRRIEWDEGTRVLRYSTHRAAKPHTCVECDKEISPGHEYLQVVALWREWSNTAITEVGWSRQVMGLDRYHIGCADPWWVYAADYSKAGSAPRKRREAKVAA